MHARLAAAALSLAVPLCAGADARAQGPAAETRPGTRPRPLGPLDGPGGKLRREPAVQLVLQGGFDLGSTKLVEVPRSDGTTTSLKANQGLSFSVGTAFLKIAGGRLAMQATIGVESWDVDSSSGGANWLAFPVEVMEMFYLDPIRVGVGASYLLSPSLQGNGALASVDVEFESSLGFVLQADWVARAPGSARGGRLTFGPRFVIQKLTPKVLGASPIDASSFGVVLGFTG